jgi:glutamate synthase domain-containing protein 3
MESLDLQKVTIREVNQFLHSELLSKGVKDVQVINTAGEHSIAVGLDADCNIDVLGHAGYYVGGMNKKANITVHGNAGWGAAENMMSGSVRIKGFASAAAGASGHGGTLIVEGNTGLRCGISMKGIDIVVGGNIGNFSGFMAQAGRMVVCGNTGEGLGDSLYEAVIYVKGAIKSLGADAQIEDMTDSDYASVQELLDGAGFYHDPKDFKRVASAKKLYNWNADADQEY